MRLPVHFAVALTALSLAAAAQEVAAPAATSASAQPAEIRLAQATTPRAAQRGAATSAEEAPEATPAPKKKRGFFQRLFGRKERATPAPAATPAAATPTPTPKPRTRTRKPEAEAPETEPTPKTEEKAPAAPTKPAAEPSETKSAATTSKGAKGSKAAAATEEKKEEKTPEQLAVEKAIASGDKAAIEKAKYDEVKSRAMKDEKIQALKAKADAAPTEEEGRKALRAYNKALFQKMRTLDGSLRNRIDRMEAAIMKRL